MSRCFHQLAIVVQLMLWSLFLVSLGKAVELTPIRVENELVDEYKIPARMAVYHLPLVSDEDATVLCIAANEAGIQVDDLAAVWWAETELGTNLKHINPVDKGHFGLSRRWRAERVSKWGEYDPNDLASSARIAALELAEGYAYFREREKMFAEYHQGRTGVLTNGVKQAYIRRIDRYLKLCK